MDRPWRGRPAGERCTSTAFSRTSCPTGAMYCLQMRGLRQTGACGEGEARLVLAQTRGTCPGCHTARALDHDMNCPKTAWTRTTRHDMIVSCLYLRLSREFNAGLEIKTHSHLRPEPEPDTWPSTVQDHRRGRHPAPPDGPLLQREAQEAQGRDPDRLRGGTLHPVWRHLEELHVDVEKLSIRAALPSHTWPRRPTNI